MKIHEYQAKKLFADFGVPVPKGEVARTGAEAGVIAERLGGRVVVKAQIHAGGRGKGGGIDWEYPGYTTNRFRGAPSVMCLSRGTA